MFTGLIQQTGIIKSKSGGKLHILPDHVLEDPQIGESIAVNGCCLTLERIAAGNLLEFHTLQETLNRTNIAALPCGSRVNLERALRANDRLGGHIVQGHVDTTAPVKSLKIRPDGDFEFSVSLAPEFAPLIVEKGSVAIDGVSLTVAGVDEDSFCVCLIPQTLKDTALSDRKPGIPVNLEFDIIGRYLLRRLELQQQKKPITMQTLLDAGF